MTPERRRSGTTCVRRKLVLPWWTDVRQRPLVVRQTERSSRERLTESRGSVREPRCLDCPRVVLPEADLADVVAGTGRLRQGEVPAADTWPAHAEIVTATGG